mmetsp:Transcript_11114/g.18528  ORF Transcript_11114/g.18528 Transcript_11114/m.18528 type:complete len:167 (-) Transcript_11114:118-618(-)|eukprot:CAMPEP_0197716556 /NCGR_PEP_ID=MMETSP1434-20131217/1410_1 /TAXON_ID=265543 /ORGANISM="Minutocellus polymorphus, Strain CCMP3303" /LENGTH=166 /DNA_ID=CAMNT_0043300937 /DNA_START=42 /DNA_END=542 /DNA_ORIENTATION=+
MMKATATASCLAAIIVASNWDGGECAKAGSLSVPTAFAQPRWRQTIISATTATKSAPPSAALFASAGNEDDNAKSGLGFSGGDDEREQAQEEFIGEGSPIELESLRAGQQSSTFMGLEPLSEGEDPFDQGIPLVTGTIVLAVSTWLTLAPFFMDFDAADLPPPPGM